MVARRGPLVSLVLVGWFWWSGPGTVSAAVTPRSDGAGDAAQVARRASLDQRRHHVQTAGPDGGTPP